MSHADAIMALGSTLVVVDALFYAVMKHAFSDVGENAQCRG
jgi:hypothetical protein